MERKSWFVCEDVSICTCIMSGFRVIQCLSILHKLEKTRLFPHECACQSQETVNIKKWEVFSAAA